MDLISSPKVFKVGSRLHGDLTRLRNQFPDLGSPSNVIDLKTYCEDRSVIRKAKSAGLASIAAQVLNAYLPRDHGPRNSEDELPKSNKDYAALDVHTSRLVFAEASKHPLPELPSRRRGHLLH